jgi:Flp pilus assembly CpaF family ATPase
MIISGGTGAGKTTLLNILSGYIPAVERVVTIEDAAELQLQQPHVVRMETRPPNIEGRGEITQRSWCATHCACARTASSSAKSGAPRPWTCCRP